MASNLASELSGTQVVELVMRLGKAGLTVEQVKKLMGDDEEMKEFVKNGLKKDPYLAIPAAGAYRRYAARAEGRAFSAPVEYAQLPYDMLKQAFDRVHDGYKSAKFEPIDVCKDVSTENREVQFELVHLNKDVGTQTVLAELDRHGLRPALYEELIAFAAKYPDLQKQFPIVALGSICFSAVAICSCSPYLDWYEDGRGLHFVWDGRGWDGPSRFLAVSK